MNRLVLVAISGLCAACSGGTKVSCGPSGDGCECGVTDDLNDGTGGSCKATDFSGGRCCATKATWPDVGAVCSCSPMVCGKSSANSTTCSCSINPFHTVAIPTASCETPAGGFCCAHPSGTCGCSTTACAADDTLVASCNADALGCQPDEFEVNRCSEAPSGGGTCVNKQGGTDMAPCVHDSDCLSNFCDETGNPGPYCHVPQPQDIAAGRGLTCSTDASCDAAQPGFSGVGKCHTGSPDIYEGCEFYCP